ncbi:MAG: hypothetical protein R3F11_08210 [Verrucomicrobiales bacterium]
MLCPTCREILDLPDADDPAEQLAAGAVAAADVEEAAAVASREAGFEADIAAQGDESQVPGRKIESGEPFAKPLSTTEDPAVAKAREDADRHRRQVRRKARRVEVPDWDRDPSEVAFPHDRTAESVAEMFRWIAEFSSSYFAILAIFTFRDPAEVVLDEPEQDRPVVLQDKERERRLSRITPIVKSFLEAPTLDALASVSRDPQKALPKMREFYARGGGTYRPFGMREIGDFTDALFIGRATILPVQTGDFEERSLAVIESEDGTNAADWESFVGYGELGWEEMLATRPEEPVLMRVRARLDSYYNFGFADERAWVCLSMEDIDGRHQVFAYTPRNGPVAPKLYKIIADSPDQFLAIVRLRFRRRERREPGDPERSRAEGLGRRLWQWGGRREDDAESGVKPLDPTIKLNP